MANVGHPQPAQQPVDLVGQRWGGWGLDGHPPKPSQERVERCSDCSSRARGECDDLAAVVREDRGEIAVGEPAGIGRGP